MSLISYKIVLIKNKHLYFSFSNRHFISMLFNCVLVSVMWDDIYFFETYILNRLQQILYCVLLQAKIVRKCTFYWNFVNSIKCKTKNKEFWLTWLTDKCFLAFEVDWWVFSSSEPFLKYPGRILAWFSSSSVCRDLWTKSLVQTKQRALFFDSTICLL